MEEKDVDLWGNGVHDIIQKETRKVCKKYERNERLYIHRIFHMEKVMPLFEYEPLVMSLEQKTSYEEEDKRDIDGVRPSGIGVQEEPKDLRGGKDSPKRVDAKQTFEQVKFVL